MGRTMWCPACSAPLDVTRHDPGVRVRCGECKTIVFVPDDIPEAAPISPARVQLGVPRSPSAVPPGAAPGQPPQLRRTTPPPLRSGRRAKVPNLVPWAIVATLLCCWIGGIIAIIHAVKANSAADRGQMTVARRAEKTARTWLWISAATPPIVLVLLKLFQLAPPL